MRGLDQLMDGQVLPPLLFHRLRSAQRGPWRQFRFSGEADSASVQQELCRPQKVRAKVKRLGQVRGLRVLGEARGVLTMTTTYSSSR